MNYNGIFVKQYQTLTALFICTVHVEGYSHWQIVPYASKKYQKLKTQSGVEFFSNSFPLKFISVTMKKSFWLHVNMIFRQCFHNISPKNYVK